MGVEHIMSAAPDEAGSVAPEEFAALLADLLNSEYWWLPAEAEHWSSRVYVLTGSVRRLTRLLDITSRTGREPMPVGHRLAWTEPASDEDEEYPEFELTVAHSGTDPAEVVAAARAALTASADVCVLFHLEDAYVAEAALFRLTTPLILPNENLMSGTREEEHLARWFLIVEGKGAWQAMEAVEDICEDHFGTSQHIVEAVR